MKSKGQNDTGKRSGSPNKSEPDFLAIGKLRKPFGLRGEMKIEVFTDHLDVLKSGSEVFTDIELEKRKISTFRKMGNTFVIHFSGIDNPEIAKTLNNQLVYIESNLLPELDKGSYYYHQLIGLTVEDENGAKLGVLKEILETGANDVYVVFNEENQKEILIPAIKSAVIKIDIESKLIIVKVPKWYE